MAKQKNTAEPRLTVLGALEGKVRHANAYFATCERNALQARLAAQAAVRSLNEAQRSLDLHVEELREAAHRDSYWKR